MKDLDTFLKTVADGMKNMAQGVEALAEKLEKMAKSQKDVKAKKKDTAEDKPSKKAVAPKPAKKAVPKKEKPMTAADTLLGVVKRSRKGIDTATLIEKTGYNQKKVANLIFKLKKQGKIKSVKKGVYVKA
ncbi:MAG: hypothetical protein ABII68_04070 [Pseudomonadota bacterium]|jgi:predicted Rossmann fold nucleotide-binding protein DprA/Smf involved in DNA uptake